MDIIDKQYLKTPFYGTRRMKEILNRLGHNINRKKVRRLMKAIGIEAIYPKKHLSTPDSTHRIFPYLLKNLQINAPNFVWSADITYIKLKKGYVYLVALLDWFSRYVLSWKISNSLTADFCIEALEEALSITKSMPAIFNSDQGSQFTSNNFTKILLNQGVKISMDGRGRAFDNIFIERLWRSLKYEEVYIKEYETVLECKQGVKNYFNFYNKERPHQSLNYKFPYEVHYDLV